MSSADGSVSGAALQHMLLAAELVLRMHRVGGPVRSLPLLSNDLIKMAAELVLRMHRVGGPVRSDCCHD